MLVFIATLLGIPLWLILGGLILLLWQRYQFKHEADVFELKLRLMSEGIFASAKIPTKTVVPALQQIL